MGRRVPVRHEPEAIHSEAHLHTPAHVQRLVHRVLLAAAPQGRGVRKRERTSAAGGGSLPSCLYSLGSPARLASPSLPALRSAQSRPAPAAAA
eukprot:4979778-Prymnesium_polylepis.1